MGRDQLLVHVARVAGGVADPVQALDFSRRADQPAKRPAVVRVGVDVLTQQRDLAHALLGQAPRLVENGGGGPRPLGAARIGHHAEAAEFVATLLHSQEGRIAEGAPRGALQPVELGFGREVGREPLAAGAGGARDQLRQLVVALRPHNEVGDRRAGHDLGAFRLGHAAGHRHRHVAPAVLGLGALRALIGPSSA
jgi:hypothetical protein